MKTFKVALTLMTVGLFITAMSVPATANHSWGGYHWGFASTTLSEHDLTIVNSMTNEWAATLSAATNDWSSGSAVLNLRSESTSPNSSCDPIRDKIRACNGSYGNTGWLGVAQIWLYVGSKHIAQGTAKMNDTYFSQPPYDTSDWRRMVVCQEVAHAFGLDHQDENFNNTNLGSCMDYTNSPAGPPSNVSPNAHDFAQLQSCYTSHTDPSSTSCASKKRGNTNARGGKDSITTARVGRYDVVTFILWAD